MISPTFTSFGTPSPAGMPSEQPLFVYVVFQWLAHTCPLSCSSGQGQRPPILPFEWLWIGDSPNQGQLLWHIIHHFVNPSNPSASWLLVIPVICDSRNICALCDTSMIIMTRALRYHNALHTARAPAASMHLLLIYAYPTRHLRCRVVSAICICRCHVICHAICTSHLHLPIFFFKSIYFT